MSTTCKEQTIGLKITPKHPNCHEYGLLGQIRKPPVCTYRVKVGTLPASSTTGSWSRERSCLPNTLATTKHHKPDEIEPLHGLQTNMRNSMLEPRYPNQKLIWDSNILIPASFYSKFDAPERRFHNHGGVAWTPWADYVQNQDDVVNP